MASCTTVVGANDGNCMLGRYSLVHHFVGAELGTGRFGFGVYRGDDCRFRIILGTREERVMAKAKAKPKKKAKSKVNEAGNYTKPSLRKRIFSRIKSGTKGGKAGQWSARKAQMLASAYKKAGGGYKD